MKNVIETERGLTLKEVRLQWFSQAGQCLANLRQEKDGPLVCTSVPECYQYLDNIISTMLPGGLAHKEATELKESVEQELSGNSQDVESAVSNRGALAKNDSWMTIAALERRYAQEYFKRMGVICLKHGQFPIE